MNGDADQNVESEIREQTEPDEPQGVVPPAADSHPAMKRISSTANLVGLVDRRSFCFGTLEDYNAFLTKFCDTNRIDSDKVA